MVEDLKDMVYKDPTTKKEKHLSIMTQRYLKYHIYIFYSTSTGGGNAMIDLRNITEEDYRRFDAHEGNYGKFNLDKVPKALSARSVDSHKAES